VHRKCFCLMTAAFSLLCLNSSAGATIFTITYTGTVDSVQASNFFPNAPNFSNLLGPFTMVTSVDTGDPLGGQFVGTATNFTYSDGIMGTITGNDFPRVIPDTAVGSIGRWGGLGVTMSLDGSHVTQSFYTNQGLPGTFPGFFSVNADIGGTGSGGFSFLAFAPGQQPFFETGEFTIDSASSDQIPGIPEPSTWAMLLIGFVGMGYAAYRRSRNGPSSLWHTNCRHICA
jgi:hypothetical protein